MNGFREQFLGSILHAYPLLSGCGSIANSALARRIAPMRPVEVWVRGPGGQMLVPLDDYVGRAVYLAGDLDRKVTRLCRTMVRPGDTVLDIGANYGLVTTLLARLVGPSGQVHAFEPNPSVLELLGRTIVQERSGGGITLHRIGLGEREETLTLVAPQANAGAASFSRSEDAGESFRVCVRTLDDVVREHGLERIRFIKIDVEGHEPQVLRGGAWTMEHLQPTSVLFELNDRSSPLRDHPTIQLILNWGYRLFSIPRAKLVLRLIPFDESSSAVPDGHDFLAIAPTPDGDDLMRTLRLT